MDKLIFIPIILYPVVLRFSNSQYILFSIGAVFILAILLSLLSFKKNSFNPEWIAILIFYFFSISSFYLNTEISEYFFIREWLFPFFIFLSLTYLLSVIINKPIMGFYSPNKFPSGIISSKIYKNILLILTAIWGAIFYFVAILGLILGKGYLGYLILFLLLFPLGVGGIRYIPREYFGYYLTKLKNERG